MGSRYLGMRTRDEITRNESTGNEITGKQMVVHVGNSSTVDDVLELGMLFETEEVGPVEVFKEMGLINNESEEESDHTRSYTWIVVLWSQDDDLDCHWIMTHLARASNLLVRKLWNEELRNIQLEPRKDTLILVKNDNERVRVRCEGTIPALVPYVAIDTNMNKNVFSQTKGGPVIRENINSGNQTILGKDKIMEGKSKKVITLKKVDKNSCLGTHALLHTLKNATTGNYVEVIKSLATNPDIPASWVVVVLSLLAEDLGIESNFNYTFISDRQKGLIQAIASVFPSAEHMYCVRHIHENMKSQFKGGVYKEMLWNAAKATFKGEFKKKMGELKSINYDAYDWLMKIPLKQWIRAYFLDRAKLLMKRIVVVQKVIAKTVGPLTPSVTKMFDAIKRSLLSTMFNGMEVFLYQVKEPLQVRLETWAHVYSFKVNPCNGRDMWPVVESRTVIILPLYKPPIGGSPKEEERMSQMMRLQVKVFRQASFLGRASQSVVVNVAIQAAGATNVSGQAAGARKVSGQAAGAGKASSQPSAAQSTTKQGPRQGFSGQ
ncbi:mutator type transposase [Tanacetum coccineum]